MPTLRESSRGEWGTNNSIEHINSGSLQRIADATEKMAKNYEGLINDRNMFKRLWEESERNIVLLKRQIAGLRGYIKRLKIKHEG